MLKTENLRFSYGRRSPEVLRGVSLELRDGEIGILLGRNGCGKTTLFQNILGICEPTGGRVLFDGEDMKGLNRRDRAERIAYVPQHIHFGDLRVYDSILLGRVSRFGMKAGPEDFAVVDPNLNADSSVLSISFCKTVVDICTKCLKRNCTL